MKLSGPKLSEACIGNLGRIKEDKFSIVLRWISASRSDYSNLDSFIDFLWDLKDGLFEKSG